jgi:hypothetical protein
MLAAGKVSNKIRLKLCQYDVTTEKSENISEEKFRNPDLEKSDKSIFNTGTKAIIDTNKVVEKITMRRAIKNRSSLRMRFSIFSNKSLGG